MVFMPPPGRPQGQCRLVDQSHDELLPTLEPLSSAIASGYQELCDIVQKHGEKISDNWNGLDKEAKRDLLFQAMPHMLKRHLPDLEMYLSQRWRNVRPQFTLDADGTFDNFALEHMAKVHASEFFTFRERVLAAFSAQILNDQLRQLKGVSLDSQRGVYQFLVKWVEAIASVKFGGPKGYKRCKQPKTPFRSTEVVAQAVLAAEVEQAPYRVPSALDFDHLQAIIAGRLSVAEDHIWTLREDTSYLKDTAQAYEKHQRQNLRTAQSGSAPDNKSAWAQGLEEMIVKALNIHHFWSIAHDLVSNLQKASLVHRNIASDEALPKSFLELFSYLSQGAMLFKLFTMEHFKTCPRSRRDLALDVETGQIVQALQFDNSDRSDVAFVLEDANFEAVKLDFYGLSHMQWLQRKIDKDGKNNLFSDSPIERIGQIFVTYHCLH